jgi:GntR family transcriptional repressor for pyruvate dehydrogenase complex
MSEVHLRRIDITPSYRRVAEAIEQEIIEGRLMVGDLLPTEASLATQLGVNRSTVREGIRALENAGLLRRAGAKRLMIAVPDDNDVTRVFSRALSLGGVTFLELWDFMMGLEPFAAQLAAGRCKPDSLAAIEKNLERTAANLADDPMLIWLDVEFHRLVAEVTENRPLILACQPARLVLLPATRELYKRVPQARTRLLDAHRQIFEALKAADDVKARQWMLKHIRDFRRGYELAGLSLTGAVMGPGAMPRPPSR